MKLIQRMGIDEHQPGGMPRCATGLDRVLTFSTPWERTSARVSTYSVYGLLDFADLIPDWKDLGGTRQDNMYYMRAAYASATLKKQSQNGWCTSARALQARKVSLLIWPFNRRPTVDEYRDLGAYPDSTLEEELLVDALRGKVRIHVHAVSLARAFCLIAIVRIDRPRRSHAAVARVQSPHRVHTACA